MSKTDWCPTLLRQLKHLISDGVCGVGTHLITNSISSKPIGEHDWWTWVLQWFPETDFQNKGLNWSSRLLDFVSGMNPDWCQMQRRRLLDPVRTFQHRFTTMYRSDSRNWSDRSREMFTITTSRTRSHKQSRVALSTTFPESLSGFPAELKTVVSWTRPLI